MAKALRLTPTTGYVQAAELGKIGEVLVALTEQEADYLHSLLQNHLGEPDTEPFNDAIHCERIFDALTPVTGYLPS